MARPLRFRSGKVQVNIDSELASSFENVVNNLLPKTRKAVDEILDRIENEARKRWLVREKDSKGSREKIYSEVYISPNLELVAIVGNTAPYAWAIRVGVDEQNTGLDMKRRLADGLLFSPMKKATNTIADLFAEEYTRLIK